MDINMMSLLTNFSMIANGESVTVDDIRQSIEAEFVMTIERRSDR